MPHSFPRFKLEKNYHLYKARSIVVWEKVLLKFLFIILLLEVANIIETAFLPNPEWGIRIIGILVSTAFYLVAILGRALILKKMRQELKLKFINWSDFVLYLMIIGLLITEVYIPQASPVMNPVWNIKSTFTFYATYLILSVTFFNWFYQILVIATLFVYIIAYFTINLPGSEMLYIPTYIAVIICFTGFSYFFEKTKRTNFEDVIDALDKEKVWKEILDLFPEGVLLIDIHKQVIYHNHALKKILNLNIEKIEDLAQVNNSINISVKEYDSPQTTSEGSAYPIEVENQSRTFVELQNQIWENWDTKNKQRIQELEGFKSFKGRIQGGNDKKTIDIKVSKRQFSGQTVVFFIFSDISERLSVDSLRQTIEYKNRLLASVSHELRTPLNGTINFIDGAIQTNEVNTSIIEQFLIPALRASRYLLTIINDILDFSQIQHEKLKLVSFQRSIIQTAQESIDLLEIQAKKKGLKLLFETPSNGWDVSFHTDHNRLTQILTNLLSNALKFTFRGAIHFRIRNYPNKRYLKFEIQDTGIGIKEEDQAKLFKSFGKIDLEGRTYLNPQGVGLGLVISNELAKLLYPFGLQSNSEPELVPTDQPGIHFKSEQGNGSQFWFIIEDMKTDLDGFDDSLTIPREKNDVEINITVPESCRGVEPPQIHCKCQRILIADDDAFNLLALESLLNSLGYNPAVAYNGVDVLEQVEKRSKNPCSEGCQPFSVIFLDCNMPIMDGYECSKKLIELYMSNPKIKSTIVACTAAVQASERQKAEESGMTEFVAKPVSRDKVKKILGIFVR